MACVSDKYVFHINFPICYGTWMLFFNDLVCWLTEMYQQTTILFPLSFHKRKCILIPKKGQTITQNKEQSFIFSRFSFEKRSNTLSFFFSFFPPFTAYWWKLCPGVSCLGTVTLGQWFLKCGLQILGGLQGQNHFHNKTKNVICVFHCVDICTDGAKHGE